MFLQVPEIRCTDTTLKLWLAPAMEVTLDLLEVELVVEPAPDALPVLFAPPALLPAVVWSLALLPAAGAGLPLADAAELPVTLTSSPTWLLSCDVSPARL